MANFPKTAGGRDPSVLANFPKTEGGRDPSVLANFPKTEGGDPSVLAHFPKTEGGTLLFWTISLKQNATFLKVFHSFGAGGPIS